MGHCCVVGLIVWSGFVRLVSCVVWVAWLVEWLVHLINRFVDEGERERENSCVSWRRIEDRGSVMLNVIVRSAHSLIVICQRAGNGAPLPRCPDLFDNNNDDDLTYLTSHDQIVGTVIEINTYH